MAAVRAEFGSVPQVQAMIEFIESTKRGIVGGSRVGQSEGGEQGEDTGS